MFGAGLCAYPHPIRVALPLPTPPLSLSSTGCLHLHRTSTTTPVRRPSPSCVNLLIDFFPELLCLPHRIGDESKSSWKAVMHLLQGAFACALCTFLKESKRIFLGNCCCRVSASTTSEGLFVASNSLVQPYIPTRYELRLLPSDAPKFNISPLFSTAACEFGHSPRNDLAISCHKAAFLAFVCKKNLKWARLFPCARRIFRLCLSTNSALIPNLVCVRARCVCIALVRCACSCHGMCMCMPMYYLNVCACSFTYLVHVPATPPHRRYLELYTIHARRPKPCLRGSAQPSGRTTSAWRGGRFTTPCSSGQ